MNRCKVCGGPVREPHLFACDECVNGMVAVDSYVDDRTYSADELAWACRRAREAGRTEMVERACRLVDEVVDDDGVAAEVCIQMRAWPVSDEEGTS